MSTPELNEPESAGAKLPVSWGLFHKVLREMTSATREYVERTLKPLSERIAALEMIATNPPTLADAYKGTWQSTTHSRGDVVTMGGSLWLCFRATTTKPGAGDDWRLIVKRG